MSVPRHTRPTRSLRRMRPLLGTFIEIGLFDPGADAAAAIAAAFAELEIFQRLLSFQDPDSELSALNRSSGERVFLSGRTLRALRLAREMTRASGGLFNCTVGGALVARGQLPAHDARTALPVGTAGDLEIFDQAACLLRPVRITLDGIAKGLAVDRALARLRTLGVRHAWINAGGDVRVIGHHCLPVRRRGGSDTIGLANAALATSVSRETFDPTLPGGVLDAQAGMAVGEWSVLAAQAWRADALTKVAALAQPAQRAALLQRLGGRLLDWQDAATESRAA